MDFSKYLQASSRDEKQKTADEIVNAFKEVGFVYLSGHGIPDSTVKGAFAKVSLCNDNSLSRFLNILFLSRALISSICPSRPR